MGLPTPYLALCGYLSHPAKKSLVWFRCVVCYLDWLSFALSDLPSKVALFFFKVLNHRHKGSLEKNPQGSLFLQCGLRK